MTRRLIEGVRGPRELEIDTPADVRFSDLRNGAVQSTGPLVILGCALSGARVECPAVLLIGCYAPGSVDLPASAAIEYSHVGESRWPEQVRDASDRLLDGDNAVRTRAATELGELGAPEVAGLLAHALTDPEWDVRAAALGALGALRERGFPFADRELLEWMALRLGDEVDVVQERAWTVLAPLDDPELLAGAVVRGWRSEDPERVRAGLVAADRLLGERATARPMLRAMRADSVRELARHDDPRVRAAALQLLGRLRGPGDAERVLQALEDPDAAVRSSALVALRAFERPGDAAAAAPLADDDDEQVRMDALTTVMVLDESGAADVIDRARVDPSPRVRRWADVLSGRPSTDAPGLS